MKRKLPIFKVFIYCLLMVCGSNVFAQQNVNVRGAVRDTTGAIPGVSVKISGTNKATSTDGNGQFSISLPQSGKLLFSMVGYKSRTVAVADYQKNAEGVYVINISLKNDDNALDEVAVVGFGTQRKASMVSSITTINPKELKGPTSNLTTMLAGRVAGMIAYQRSGEPGGDNANFFIRGLGSFGAGKQDPLILIDGIESNNTDMARLQPDDIASFSVLKDATASAVYGARGANGVILIITKSGVDGKTKFNFRAETSLSGNVRNFQFADNISYMTMANEASLTRNPLAILPYLQTKIDATAAGENELLYPNNNWIDQLIKDRTINNRYNISATGGSAKARYYVAGTYNVDNGVLKVDKLNNFNSNIKMKNYSVRSNVNLNLTATTEAIIRVYGQFDDYRGPVGGRNSNGDRINGGEKIFNQAIWSNPVMFPAVYPASFSPFTKHPLFGNARTLGNGTYINPYAEMVRGYEDRNASTLQTQLELKQDLNFITAGLNARMMAYARRYSFFNVTRQYNPFYYTSNVQPDGQITLSALNDGGIGSLFPVGTEYLSYSEGDKELNSTFYMETAVNYNRIFKEKHAVTGMLISTMRNYLSGNAGALQTSLPSRNLGLSGRANYGYDDKYLAEFSFGYNGSERFADNNRFGFFPSFGLGYLISNEKFFEPIKSFITNLKLRATYGLVGNDQIGKSEDRFFYLSEVNMNDDIYGSRFGEIIPIYRSGISLSRYANNLITWERSKQINFAADFSFKNALDITFEVYRNTRSNILTDRTFMPSSMGLQAAIRANTNKLQSQGVDVSMNYNKSLGNGMYLQGRGNFTYVTNKILVYDEPSFSASESYRYHVGRPSTQKFGYIAERLFIDDQEAMNSPQQFGAVAGVDYRGGDIKYRDVNQDGVISDADMVPLGLPESPEIVYGFGGTVGFKGFDLSAFFQGSARSSFFINSENIAPFVFNSGSQNGLLKVVEESYWSEENRDIYAFWPRLSQNFVANNNRTSTWWMRNGSFLRLKTVELGYSLKDNAAKRLGLSSLRLYVNSSNLAAISSFKLWDPEMGGKGLGYPIQVVYNVGLNVQF